MAVSIAYVVQKTTHVISILGTSNLIIDVPLANVFLCGGNIGGRKVSYLKASIRALKMMQLTQEQVARIEAVINSNIVFSWAHDRM